jgi:dolichol-phosphate mannosyltransferase
VSSRAPLRIVELPFDFRPRLHGRSKLDRLVVLEYLALLVAKLSRELAISSLHPVCRRRRHRATGAPVGAAPSAGSGVGFDWAQTFAAYAAMTSNFVLNNELTYRDQRLRGLSALRGLISFYLICSVGTIANVGVANWVLRWPRQLVARRGRRRHHGSVFNYAASSALTWRGN